MRKEKEIRIFVDAEGFIRILYNLKEPVRIVFAENKEEFYKGVEEPNPEFKEYTIYR